MSVKFEIHPCPFESRPCDNWGCTNAFGVKKYFIGRPDASIPKPIFCEHCVRHMLSNVPLELVEGSEDLEARLRAEIEQEYERKLVEFINDYKPDPSDLDPQSLKGVQVDDGTLTVSENGDVVINGGVIEGVPDDATDESISDDQPSVDNDAPTDDQPKIFRCLDCGNEYDSAAKLGSHRRVHKEG